MKQIHNLFIGLGTTLNPWFILILVVALNVYWTVTLTVFDIQFQQVSGLQLLDLQNSFAPDEIITTQSAISQIATYSQEAKALYWSFFILDNIMPHLAFSAFALLWVYFLRSTPNRMTVWLLNSPLLFIPLGVGFFDWLENLAYISAIHLYPDPSVTAIMDIGLIFKWVKAACLLPTFLLTLVLVIYHIIGLLQRRVLNRRPVVTS
jgi:hypothetical protein